MNTPGDQFKPDSVAKWFSRIVTLPHASEQEGPLHDALGAWLLEEIRIDPGDIYFKKFAAAQGVGERVIYAFRRGTGPGAGLPPVVLQAHMDMVVVTSPAVDNPFPLQTSIDDAGWMTAKARQGGGSTLGADDGIGVATALALLEDEQLRPYPIECLFTVQEETDMGGAHAFDTSLLKGKIYVNLDSEQVGVVTYGSAGGFKTQYTGAITRAAVDGAAAVKITIGGLLGGHSGVDIGKGRLSAVKLLVEGLCRMNRRLNDMSLPAGSLPGCYDFWLDAFQRLDTNMSNAIPREASATIAVRAEDVDAVMASFAAWFGAVKTIYGAAEAGMTMSCERTTPAKPLTTDATDNLLAFLHRVPQGVMGMVAGYTPAVVETSSNVYDVQLGDDQVEIDTSTRTSNARLLGEEHDGDHPASALEKMFVDLGAVYGLAVVTGESWYPAWPRNDASPLLADALAAYGTGAEKSIIHAGLECSWIVKRCDGIDCVALGPTIKNPHTIQETLDTTSVAGFYDAVKNLLLRRFGAV
ncbi:MAG: M20/M25/M40 family metallo-hydrolase [Minicystis sp.]